MKVLVIDAQGGGVGRQLVAALKRDLPDLSVIAVGANAAATAAMQKAGAPIEVHYLTKGGHGYGMRRGAVLLESQGSGEIKMSREYQSPHYTTLWSDIPKTSVR